VRLELTAVFEAVPEGGYVASVIEFTGADTRGGTLAEARENLREAVVLVLKANRVLVEERLAGIEVIEEPLIIVA
jgi:predicted RNase H-like HicB family nuclease